MGFAHTDWPSLIKSLASILQLFDSDNRLTVMGIHGFVNYVPKEEDKGNIANQVGKKGWSG